MIKLYDIIGNKEYFTELKHFVKNIIMNDDHKNKKNYEFLLEINDLSDYYHRFTMLKDDDEIISIQGIRHSANKMPYPYNICRIADRHYVNKKYRISHSGVRTFYYSDFCLKNDIDFLIKNIEYIDTVYMSIEGTRAYKHFERRQLKIFEEKGYKFLTDNFYYQTCINKNSKSCWQTCVYYNIRGNLSHLNLPKIEYNEWIKKND